MRPRDALPGACAIQHSTWSRKSWHDALTIGLVQDNEGVDGERAAALVEHDEGVDVELADRAGRVRAEPRDGDQRVDEGAEVWQRRSR